ncbi:MAG TPA: bis(5'-nucleosyl)-tetraphosphatase (symmetrical) YqeK [Candidatus Baltobacteraceae bacterium]|nr:bis(5'-nucleosyl)-tetraphosphatase (symmetrical) YqeK [Candidatus Baltobacteraceae bacterium]
MLNQDHRYAHVVRVAWCAENLAHFHQVSTAKARVAGMLHDLARLYSDARLIDECRARGIAIGEFERRHPIVLHAPLSAALAREHFDVEDPDVLSAIAKHTVGGASMSPLDCVLYLADGLEPGRDFPERSALWNLATRDLEAAMRGTIGQSLRYLERKGFEPAPATIAAAAAFGGAQGVAQ